MAESLTIDRDNKLPAAQDYYFLRREGIKLIEGLSGKKWTDYNTHDPGITLLEAMCYALTDLGYRTSFEISDIMTPFNKDESWEKVFYSARDILPCTPVTLVDYRKLILDTEGVRNAWIETTDEFVPLIYIQQLPSKDPKEQIFSLTYDVLKGDDTLHLRGLYKVFIEYEDDVDMNKVSKVIWGKLNEHRNLSEDFLTVTSVEYEKFTIDAIIQASEGTNIEEINAMIYKLIYDFFSPPVNFYTLDQMLEKGLSAEEIFEGPILNYGFIDTAELIKSERSKNFHLSDIIKLISGIEGVIAVKKFEFISDSQVKYDVTKFTEWISSVKENQGTPKLMSADSNVSFERSGDRNRTAAEKQVDKIMVETKFKFLKAESLKRRLRGAGADLPVPLGEFAEMENYYPFQKSLPEVYGMTEAFIDKNDRVDKVSVENAEYEILASKVGVQGAKLVRLLLKYYKDRDKYPVKKGEEKSDAGTIENLVDILITGPEKNVAFVREIIDKIFIDKSTDKLLKRIISELFPDDKEQPSNKEVLYNYVEDDPKYIIPSHKSKALARLAVVDIEIKKQIHRVNSTGDIARLASLYTIDRVGMLDKSKQKVLQLRGFLMVFEQIIADYLSQLAHVREIFSFDEKVKQNFYPQVIEDIEDMEALFIDIKKYREFHLDMVENRDSFIARRNTILDHLLGRFSESLEKYAYFLKQYAGNDAGENLITDKVEFLADYIQISSYRSKSYNYLQPDSWNSNNVEGLKRRICRLLGIKSRELDKKSKEFGLKNYNRKKIAPEVLSIEENTLEKGVERHLVKLVDPDDSTVVLMKSKREDYKFRSEANIISTYILEYGYDISLYTKKGSGDRWHFEFKRNAETVANSPYFATSNDRDNAMEKTVKVLKELSEDENFHILEHILLRPKLSEQEITSYPSFNLLPGEIVPGDIRFDKGPKKDIPYKWRPTYAIVEHQDTWNLSLMKNKEEFLTAKDNFKFFRHYTKRIERIRKLGSDRWNYITVPTKDGYFTFQIKDGETVLAERKKSFRRAEDFDEEITNLVNFFSYELDFVTSSAGQNENVPSFLADPYSFRISFIFPRWQRRFRDKTFKHLLEKTIYLETPSHIYPDMYWLDYDEMLQFDQAYENWIKAIAVPEDTPASDMVNRLIEVLNNIRKK